MADTVVLVAQTGGDYTTLEAALAAIPADLTATGGNHIIELANDADYTVNAGLVNHGTLPTVVADATHRPILRAQSGAEVNGSGVGARVKDQKTFRDVMQLADWWIVENIAIICTEPPDTQSSGVLAPLNATNAIVRNCWLENQNSVSVTSAGLSIGSSGGQVHFGNCIIVSKHIGVAVQAPAGASYTLNRCTIVSPTYTGALTQGWFGGTGTELVYTNCLSYAPNGISYEADVLGSGATSDFLAGSDTTATTESLTVGFNSRPSTDFVDYAGGDYNLSPSSRLYYGGKDFEHIGAILPAPANAGLSHIGEITLPTLAGVHTSFPVVLRHADFDAGVLAELQNDGSDLRFNLADGTPIAFHKKNFDKTTNDILVHLCAPSASTGTTIKVWGGQADAPAIPVDDQFGQYAAYAGFTIFSHDGKNRDNSSYALAYSGTEPDGVSPFSGATTGFDGIDDQTYGFFNFDLDARQTFVAMFKVDVAPSAGSYRAITSIVQSADNNRHAMLAVDENMKIRANKDRYISNGATGTTTLSAGSWYHGGATFLGWGAVDHKAYLNGLQDGATSTQDNQTRYVNVNKFVIGSRDGLDHFDGEVAHVGFKQNVEESAEWMADHASNLTAAGAWVTMTSTGGGSDLVTAIDLQQAQTISQITVSQNSVVVIDSVSQAQTIDQASASTGTEVSVDAASQAHTVGQVAVSQRSSVSVDGLSSSQTLDQVAIAQKSIVQPEGLSQSHSVDEPVLSQQSSVSVDAASQVQSVDSVGLSQNSVVSVDEASQNQSVEQLQTASGGSILLDGASQAQTVDQLVITQAHIVTVNSLAMNQIIEALSLNQNASVEIHSLSNLMGLEELIISAVSAGQISIHSISMVQNLDETAILQDSVIVLDGLSQSQLLDVVYFGGVVVGYFKGEIRVVSAFNVETIIGSTYSGKTEIL